VWMWNVICYKLQETENKGINKKLLYGESNIGRLEIE